MSRITETDSAGKVAVGWSIRSTAATATVIYGVDWATNDSRWRAIAEWLKSGGVFPLWAVITPWLAGSLVVAGGWMFVLARNLPPRRRRQETERGARATTAAELRKLTEKRR